MTTPTDWGHGCSPKHDCTLHNLHCAYPNCAKGRGEGIHAKPVTTPTPRTDADDYLAAIAAKGEA